MANKLSLAEVIGRSVSKIDTQQRERIEYIDLDLLPNRGEVKADDTDRG